ncbi:MAG TPA: hypothetical protein VF292_12220 [Rhodanobacteraceae bacterium]
MAESPRRPGESQASVARRGIRWDALAAIIASLVGLLALIVAGYTAYIQRQQVRAQVWPYIALGTSNAGGQYEIYALNNGVGPAIVKSVQVLVAGKPVKDWNSLYKAVGFASTGKQVTSTLNRIVVPAGGHVHWIRFTDAARIDAFTDDLVRSGAVFRVCYASTLGEAWMTVYTLKTMPRRRPVAACPKVPWALQFHG